MLKTKYSAIRCRGTIPRPRSTSLVLLSTTPSLNRSEDIIEICPLKIPKIWRRRILFNLWSPPDFKNPLLLKKANLKINLKCSSLLGRKATFHLSNSLERKFSLLCFPAWASVPHLIITIVVTSCTIKRSWNWVNRVYHSDTHQSCPTSAKYQKATSSSRLSGLSGTMRLRTRRFWEMRSWLSFQNESRSHNSPRNSCPGKTSKLRLPRA